jgi:tetratricopeptide (TPR) repeat protein
MSMQFLSSLSSKRLIYLILAGLCFLVYANSLANQFIYDDIPNIIKNPQIRNPFNFIFFLPALVNSLNYLLFKENPFTFHLCNIIVHSLNTILLFMLLQLFFKIEPSLLGALFFAVHPIHTEAVTWITAGNYLYFCLYVLITYLLYRRATDPLDRGEKLDAASYFFCLGIFTYAFVGHFLSFYFMMPFLLVLSDVTFKLWRKRWKLWIPFFAILIIRVFVARALILQRIHEVTWEIGTESSNPPVVGLAYSLFTHLGLLLWPAKLTLYHEIKITPLFTQAGLIALLALIFSVPYLYKKSKEIFFAVGIFVLFILPTASPIAITSLIAERYIYIPSIALSMLVAYFYQKYALENNALRKKVLIGFGVLIVIFSIRTTVRNEDWSNPQAMWKKTLETSPGTPFSRNNMGFIYQQEGKFQEAIREYLIAIQMKPNFFDAYNNLALVYRSAGEKEEAVAIYKKIIEISPGYAKAYNNLAGLYNELGYKEEAETYYKKAIELDPKYAYAYFNLGLMYEESGKKEEANKMYEKAFKIYPRLKLELSQLSIKQSIPLKQLHVAQEAPSSVPTRKSVQEEQKAPSSVPTRKSRLARETASTVPARKSVQVEQKATSAAPTRKPVQEEKAPSSVPIGKSVQVKQKATSPAFSLTAFTRKSAQAQEYNSMGVKYSMSNKHQEALEAYKKAAESDPGFADAYNNMGNSYNSLGLAEEAIEAYKKAIDINPNMAASHFNLSVSYFDMKQYDLAVTHCDIADKLGYRVPKDFLNLLKPFRKAEPAAPDFKKK